VSLLSAVAHQAASTVVAWIVSSPGFSHDEIGARAPLSTATARVTRPILEPAKSVHRAVFHVKQPERVLFHVKHKEWNKR
jgi:hypothetical protein